MLPDLIPASRPKITLKTIMDRNGRRIAQTGPRKVCL